MILHLLYIVAFTVIAFLAVRNMIRNLMALGVDSQRAYSGSRGGQSQSAPPSVPHPELLDDSGRVINEPLLVMRSMTVEDARSQLDAIFEASPSSTPIEPNEEGAT